MEEKKGEYLHRNETYREKEDKAIDLLIELEKSLPDDKRYLINELDKALEGLTDIRDNLIYELGLKQGVSLPDIGKTLKKNMQS